MKDRIKKIMESQHMSQQVFADFIGLGAATLSGIFNDRTRPTLNVVESIKKKIPDISIDWLLFGQGPMYVSDMATDNQAQQPSSTSVEGASQRHSGGMSVQEPALDFGHMASPTPQKVAQVPNIYSGVRNTRPEMVREELKFVDKPQRRVIEIRVYYDDQTWESFVPSKK